MNIKWLTLRSIPSFHEQTFEKYMIGRETSSRPHCSSICLSFFLEDSRCCMTFPTTRYLPLCILQIHSYLSFWAWAGVSIEIYFEKMSLDLLVERIPHASTYTLAIVNWSCLHHNHGLGFPEDPHPWVVCKDLLIVWLQRYQSIHLSHRIQRACRFALG